MRESGINRSFWDWVARFFIIFLIGMAAVA